MTWLTTWPTMRWSLSRPSSRSSAVRACSQRGPCKFAVLEVSSKFGRHFCHRPADALDAADWERLSDRFGISPAHRAEGRDLIVRSGAQ
jgi:hypothetical protein